VGIVKTVVTNHSRKMFRSRTYIHKAAGRNTVARVNLDKLTETSSYDFTNLFLLGKQQSVDSNIIQFHLTLNNARKINLPISATVS